MDVRVDEIFLLRMLQFAQLIDQHSQKRSRKDDAHALEMFEARSEQDRKASLSSSVTPVAVPHRRVVGLQETKKSMIYFELFHFNPIKVLFSYMATPGLRTAEYVSFSLLLSLLTLFLTD